MQIGQKPGKADYYSKFLDLADKPEAVKKLLADLTEATRRHQEILDKTLEERARVEQAQEQLNSRAVVVANEMMMREKAVAEYDSRVKGRELELEQQLRNLQNAIHSFGEDVRAKNADLEKREEAHLAYKKKVEGEISAAHEANVNNADAYDRMFKKRTSELEARDEQLKKDENILKARIEAFEKRLDKLKEIEEGIRANLPKL